MLNESYVQLNSFGICVGFGLFFFHSTTMERLLCNGLLEEKITKIKLQLLLTTLGSKYYRNKGNAIKLFVLVIDHDFPLIPTIRVQPDIHKDDICL